MLVLNIADDLLKHVLNGDETNNTAVFVDDDRHMIATVTKLLKQDVEAFAFRDEHSRSQEGCPGQPMSFTLLLAMQKILRQQDAHHAIFVTIGHGET